MSAHEAGCVCETCWAERNRGLDAMGYDADGNVKPEQLIFATESEMTELQSRPRSRKVERVVAKRASEIRPETVEWLWRGYLPLGMITLLAGLPGLGKSTLAMKLAADVTRGEMGGALLGEPADVLVITYEDALAQTAVPRLMAANADLARVHFIEAERVGDSVDLTSCVPQMDEMAARHEARLIFIDPLVAGLPAGQISSHVDQDVRSVLAPLAELAERRNLVALASMHFSKGAVDALLGVGGSIGFVGAARSVLIFGADPSDDQGEEGPARILAQRKCNVGRRQASVQCFIQSRVIDLDEGGRTAETSICVLGDESEVQADDLVRPQKKTIHPIVEAERFLRQLLADGPHRSTECIDLAGDCGISEKTLKRAKKNIGADSFRRGGFGAAGEWFWFLPEEGDDEPSPDDDDAEA